MLLFLRVTISPTPEESHVFRKTLPKTTRPHRGRMFNPLPPSIVETRLTAAGRLPRVSNAFCSRVVSVGYRQEDNLTPRKGSSHFLSFPIRRGGSVGTKRNTSEVQNPSPLCEPCGVHTCFSAPSIFSISQLRWGILPLAFNSARSSSRSLRLERDKCFISLPSSRVKVTYSVLLAAEIFLL